MRVLIISKACVVGAYQKKLEELARFPDMELWAVVPPYWQEPGGRRLELELLHTTGYNLEILPLAWNGHFHLHFYPRLGVLLRRIRPHLLHIEEEPYNLATFQAMRLGVELEAKRIFFTWQNLPRRYPPPFSWLETYNLKKAHRAISGNREGIEVLRAKGFTRAVDLLPQFGVDPEIYRPQAKQTFPKRPFTIGYIGRLVEEKGIDLLIDAVARLEGDFRLRILGSGPFRSQLQAMVQELGLGSKVIFDPPQPSAAMPKYYHGLDVLVLPSRTRKNWKEQFGRVLIEAMASGVPVIGSSCGEIPNVIGDVGLIFPEGDVQALQGVLQKLREDKELRQRLAEAGRARVLAHFTQAWIAAETYRIYLELL